MRYAILVYDIPADQSAKLNPSTKLRRVGFRINMSCWIIPETHIPQEYLETLRSNGVQVVVFLFDEAESKRIRVAAANALRDEADKLRQFLEHAMQTFSAKIREAADQRSTPLINHATRYLQTALRRAAAEVEDAKACAACFDLTQDIGPVLENIRQAIDACRNRLRHDAAAARGELRRPNQAEAGISLPRSQQDPQTRPGTEDDDTANQPHGDNGDGFGGFGGFGL